MRMLKVFFICLLTTLTGYNAVSSPSPQKSGNAVISGYSGGRFGDNVLACAQTLYFSLKNNCPMFLVPFPYSEQLLLDEIMPKNSPEIEKQFAHKKIFWNEGSVMIKNGTEKSLFVVPYFPQAAIEYSIQTFQSFPIDWDDAEFKSNLRTLIAPKKPLTLVTPPKDKISVAVHLRKGGGFDNENHIYLGIHIYKTPFDDYYINQIRQVSHDLNNQPLYVFLFTDDKDPQALVERYKQTLNIPSIEFDCRKEGNKHDANVLEDFFSMMHFDVLIRPESNFSIMAEKLGTHALVVSPGEFIPNSRIQKGIHSIKKTLMAPQCA